MIIVYINRVVKVFIYIVSIIIFSPYFLVAAEVPDVPVEIEQRFEKLHVYSFDVHMREALKRTNTEFSRNIAAHKNVDKKELKNRMWRRFCEFLGKEQEFILGFGENQYKEKLTVFKRIVFARCYEILACQLRFLEEQEKQKAEKEKAIQANRAASEESWSKFCRKLVEL